MEVGTAAKPSGRGPNFGNSTLFYSKLEYTPVRHVISDASFHAVGGFSSQVNVFWMYDFYANLSNRLRELSATREASDIIINL